MKNLSLYKINKRINSTLLPTAEQLIGTMGVALKNATSIDTPTFVIAVGAADIDAIWSANYAEYEGSYYWINDITQINNTHVELQCKKDSLATYKDYINSSKLDVIYSSSAGRTDIIDERLTMKSTNVLGYATLVSAAEIPAFKNDMSYILEVVNDDGNSMDTPYVIDSVNMARLSKFFLNDAMAEELRRYFSEPIQAVIKLQGTYLNTNNIRPFTERVKIGPFEAYGGDDYITGYKITPFESSEFDYYTTLGIPWYYNDFRMRNPFTNMSIYLPFVGLVELDASKFYGTTTLEVHLYVEYTSGNLIYEILAEKPGDPNQSVKVAQFNGNCNASIPVAQILHTNKGALLEGITMGTLGAVMGNPVVMAGGYLRAAQGFVNNTQISGNLSSLLGKKVGTTIELYLWSQNSADTPDNYRAVKGLPLYSAVELSTLSGYVQCSNASVTAPAMESEIREINNFLNGGVYLE